MLKSAFPALGLWLTCADTNQTHGWFQNAVEGPGMNKGKAVQGNGKSCISTRGIFFLWWYFYCSPISASTFCRRTKLPFPLKLDVTSWLVWSRAVCGIFRKRSSKLVFTLPYSFPLGNHKYSMWILASQLVWDPGWEECQWATISSGPLLDM